MVICVHCGRRAAALGGRLAFGVLPGGLGTTLERVSRGLILSITQQCMDNVQYSL